MTTPIHITLPGPPVAYAVEPARLVAWLLSHGWTHDGEGSRVYELTRDGASIAMVRVMREPRELAEAVATAAWADGLEPHVLAALLASPTADGPALQWAHANADTRRQAIDDIAGFAVSLRGSAERSRSHGRPADALAHEGRAMGLEAAAAVLRVPSLRPKYDALRGELMRAGQTEALTVLDKWAARE